MKLYIVQHGEAVSKEDNPERPLTQKGKEDCLKTATFLKKSRNSPKVIIHSSKTRAIETAAVFVQELGVEYSQQKIDLSPNDSINGILSCIQKSEKDMIIVGHLPFLQKLTSYLLTGSESANIVKFNMGSCVCLEKSDDAQWELLFYIIPDAL